MCKYTVLGFTECLRLLTMSDYSDPADRPTADTLLRAPFCSVDPHFNFLDTELYSKIRPNFDQV